MLNAVKLRIFFFIIKCYRGFEFEWCCVKHLERGLLSLVVLFSLNKIVWRISMIYIKINSSMISNCNLIFNKKNIYWNKLSVHRNCLLLLFMSVISSFELVYLLLGQNFYWAIEPKFICAFKEQKYTKFFLCGSRCILGLTTIAASVVFLFLALWINPSLSFDCFSGYQYGILMGNSFAFTLIATSSY